MTLSEKSSIIIKLNKSKEEDFKTEFRQWCKYRGELCTHIIISNNFL